MFKKIELWVVLLIFIIFFIFLIVFGEVLRHTYKGGDRYGTIGNIFKTIAEIPVNMKRILSSGEDLKVQVPKDFSDKKVFTRYITKERNKLLLLTRFDGDTKTPLVEVKDLNTFKTLHTYSADLENLLGKINTTDKEFEHLKKDLDPTFQKRFLYQHPIVDENLNLIFSGYSLGALLYKIDFCSNYVWSNATDIFHHSHELDHENNIWAPIYVYPYENLEKYNEKKYFTDENNFFDEKENEFFDNGIAKVDQNGKRLLHKSVVDILIENNLEDFLLSKAALKSNPIHLNDIQPANFDSKYWKKGDIFLSNKHLYSIIHYRPDTNKIISILYGDREDFKIKFYNHETGEVKKISDFQMSTQHDVDIISDKEIAFFHNAPNNPTSDIKIFNYETMKITKKFNDSFIKHSVKTPAQGLFEILDDGSLFVEENNSGRLLLFDENGELEWEYINRDENGNIYSLGWTRIIEDQEIIAKFKNKSKLKNCDES